MSKCPLSRCRHEVQREAGGTLSPHEQDRHPALSLQELHPLGLTQSVRPGGQLQPQGLRDTQSPKLSCLATAVSGLWSLVSQITGEIA